GVANGIAFWSEPQRTDARGHLRLRVPLGDVETTWRVVLVAVPDGEMPATTTVDIPALRELSVRVDTGAAWTEGDEGGALLAVRNRTARALRVALAATPGGVATRSSGDAGDAGPTTLDVPAGAARTTTVRVATAHAGGATLDVRARAAGVEDDVVRHTWEVRS